MRLRQGLPLWLDRSPSHRRTRFPTHRGTLSVDIVIVGGGITGAIAAHLFSSAGIRVAVVEAETCGPGGTAASTALLMQEQPEYGWEGLFAETPDGLPYIRLHTRYPRSRKP